MTDRPNILLLMTDQHSKYHLGCYGDELVRTPNLDRLANEGMRFDNTYCASPVCVPSRMSFMTSRRPSANRVWNNNHVLRSDIPTWAHALGIAGYETALIGRMHFVGTDHRHGFEKRPIGEYSAHHPGASRQGGPHLVKLAGTSGQTRRAVEVAGRGRTSYQAFDDMIAEKTCEYLREKSESSQDRPFAAVAGFVLPHCPFAAPNDLFDYYYDKVDVPQPTDTERASAPPAIRKFKQLRGLYPPLDEERIRVARAAYFGLCEYFDTLAGQVLNTLDQAGLAENTLVIYCSDHGEMAGEHGCWWKSNYYEGSVGVPMIARMPGRIAEGSTNPVICNLMDIGPTFCEISDAEPLHDLDGLSLCGEMTGSAPLDRDETFSEHVGQEGIPSRMIRTGDWKYYEYHDNTPPVLYNLAADPNELFDLGTNSAYESIRLDLSERLHNRWDPPGVLDQISRMDQDLRIIEGWGRATEPRHPDTLPIPEDAEDVELL
ncbi:sulfatase-like hydrolase/transferase [bacterium]|nr:sulfatase-like hydrolase/transferase [bacterium]